MTGLGTRRLVGWLAVLLAILLVGGYLSRDEFAALFQAVLHLAGVFA